MEAVDRSYGEALTARAAALGGVRGIGPPDLCYLKRRSRPVLGRTGQRLIGSTLGRISASAADALGGGGQVDGFYHHVLGVSAVSLATISAYLAELAQTDATSGWASSWEVIGAVYCCWDAFGRQDLRVHLSIPGGVRAFVVRPDGTYTSETPPPDMWRSIGVSALLRAYCTPPSGLPCVRVHRTSLSSEDEIAFLDAAEALMHGEMESSSECAPERIDAERRDDAGMAVDALLWRYFERSHRFGQALAFFSRVAGTTPRAARYVAAAQRALGALPDAIATLALMLLDAPASPPLLIAQA